MGLFNLFAKEEQGARLMQIHDFVASYLLVARNEFIMGKENPVLSVCTESNILLRQTIHEKAIQTEITLQAISGKTDDKVLQPQLKQMLALAEISKQLLVERNSQGKMQRIANLDTINEEWQNWKQTRLPELFQRENEQAQFADTFEKGLLRMDESIRNNLNYFILMPDIYHIKQYTTPSNAGAELLLHSRLIADMPVRCRMVPVEISEAGDRASVKLESELLNFPEIKKQHLKTYYKQQSGFSIAEYGFAIDLNYEIDSTNGKILSGNLFLKEKMHDHLQYILHLQVDVVDDSGPTAQQQPGQTSHRRFLADEIMDNKG